MGYIWDCYELNLSLFFSQIRPQQLAAKIRKKKQKQKTVYIYILGKVASFLFLGTWILVLQYQISNVLNPVAFLHFVILMFLLLYFSNS